MMSRPTPEELQRTRLTAKELERETKLATEWRLTYGRERNTPYHFSRESFYRDVQVDDFLAHYKAFVLREGKK